MGLRERVNKMWGKHNHRTKHSEPLDYLLEHMIQRTPYIRVDQSEERYRQACNEADIMKDYLASLQEQSQTKLIDEIRDYVFNGPNQTITSSNSMYRRLAETILHIPELATDFSKTMNHLTTQHPHTTVPRYKDKTEPPKNESDEFNAVSSLYVA